MQGTNDIISCDIMPGGASDGSRLVITLNPPSECPVSDGLRLSIILNPL